MAVPAPSLPPRFTSFAVAGGSGFLGRAIVDGLVAAPGAERVLILSRSGETKVPQGAEVAGLDFDSLESVTKALKGIEVVISCLRDTQATQQPILAEAAKAAGCSLFLPGEFGTDSSEYPPGSFLYHKRTAVEHLEQIGLPYLRVLVGQFPETTISPKGLGFDFANGNAHLIGTGDEPYSFTLTRDIGAFVGPLLTSTSPAELLSLKHVSIEGSRASLNDLVRCYEASHPGKKLEVTYTSLDDAQKEHDGLKEGEGGYRKVLLWALLEWARAGGVTKNGSVALDNWRVEEWRPTAVADYLAGLA